MTEVYFRRAPAACYIRDKGLPCSEKTLAKYAVIGGGPIFSKFGRYPIYTAQNLDSWIQARIGKPVSSTSEYSSTAAADTKAAECAEKASNFSKAEVAQ